MDRRTATAMSYMLVANRMAKMHGIPQEDMYALMTILAVSAHATGTNAGAVASGLFKAPPHVIESMKAIIAIIKDRVAAMETDPDFMAQIEAKATELSLL